MPKGDPVAVDQSVKGVSLGVLYDPSSRFLTIRNWYKETHRVLRS